MTNLDLSEYDSDVYELRDGHIAVSPFDEYPGELTFPKVFTGKMFKRYAESVKDEAEKDELEGMWATFLLFAELNVKGLSADYDDNDLRLNRWCVAMLARWGAPFLFQAPWRKPYGNGSVTTDQPPG